LPLTNAENLSELEINVFWVLLVICLE